MKKIYLPLVATATLLAFALTVTAAPRPKMFFTGDASTRWTNTGNWTLNNGSSGNAGRIPQNGDSIVITIQNGGSAYVGPSSSNPTANISLTNVIIIVQKGATLQIGNGSGNEGTLTLDNTSVVSLEATGSTRGRITASPNNSINQITIGGVIKFQGNLHYTINTSNTGIVTGPARATKLTGSGVNGFILGALPVVLMGFNANLTSTNAVKIDWNTQQEINTDRFEVQRSGDGISWQTLATLKASGFSSTPKNYSYEDPAPQKGVNLYRLKTIDFDGNFGYSGVTNVRLNTQGKISVFPNPTVSVVTVSLGEAPASDWTLSLRNLFGQTVMEKKFGKDYTTASLNVGSFPTGSYMVEINIGSAKQITKLVIAH